MGIIINNKMIAEAAEYTGNSKGKVPKMEKEAAFLAPLPLPPSTYSQTIPSTSNNIQQQQQFPGNPPSPRIAAATTATIQRLHRRARDKMGSVNALVYLLAASCVLINLYVLLNRSDTIHYLRIYHLAVGALMFSCGILQLIFMWQARNGEFPKLSRPYTIPRPTMVSAFALTTGIALGYAYFLVFNIAFSNCDKMIDATGAEEQWQEAIYNLLMISFCVLSLVYIWQRAYFGSQESQFDLFTRKWVNVVLTIVWVKIVVFKGYLSYQELCQRKEISGYWCPVIKRTYTCDPELMLKGTQKIWYYMHKGLLNSAIISCASEFFPVMLVAHWLACGRAEHRADQLIKKRQEKKSIRRMLQGMIGDVSKIYGLDPSAQHRRELPALEIQPGVVISLLFLAWFTGFMVTLRWFVGLYFAILFDQMHKLGSMLDDYAECTASIVQLLLFGTLWIWSRRKITFKRFDPHHKAESRGDLVLIFGSAAFMSVKLILQVLELHFQRADGFLPWGETLLRTFSLTVIQLSEWLQFLCLRRIMALHFEDVHATRRFLPSVALAAVVVNWVGFGMTFFETNTIKYQLGLSEHRFSQSTLISMIFTQTIYPADYLFCFTAAGCWTDVLLRYVEMGLFQLGPTLELEDMEELEHHHHHGERKRSYAQPMANGRRWSRQEDSRKMSTTTMDRPPLSPPTPRHHQNGIKPTMNGRLKGLEEEEPEMMTMDKEKTPPKENVNIAETDGNGKEEESEHLEMTASKRHNENDDNSCRGKEDNGDDDDAEENVTRILVPCPDEPERGAQKSQRHREGEQDGNDDGAIEEAAN